MPSVRTWLAAAAAAVLLLAVTLLALGYWQRGHHIGDLEKRLAAARSALNGARSELDTAQGEARRLTTVSQRTAQAAQANRKRYLAAEDRLQNPRPGPVPRTAE